MSMTEASKKTNLKALKKSGYWSIPCIHYLDEFNKNLRKALINTGSKVNTIYTSFMRKSSLCICKIYMGIQKIDSDGLKTYGIVITSFWIHDKVGKFCFYKQIFLYAQISIDARFQISFPLLNNIEVKYKN